MSSESDKSFTKIRHNSFRFAEVQPNKFLVYHRHEVGSLKATISNERYIGWLENAYGRGSRCTQKSWGWYGMYPDFLHRALAEFKASRVVS